MTRNAEHLHGWSTAHSRGLAALILLAAALEFLDFVRASWGFTTDDMYISLRYAQHWVQGEGLAWNNGGAGAVEGYSNFSFVALAAAAMAVGLDPVVTLKIVCVLSVLLTCIPLYALARLQVGPVLATVPGVILFAFPGTVWWAVSGLETLMFVLLAALAVTTFVYALGRRPGATATPSSRLMFVAGFIVALASLTRPEAPLIGIAMLIGLLAHASRGSRFKLAAALAVGFTLLYVPYFAWRTTYFGHLLPNTVACKAAYDGNPWQLILESSPLLGVVVAASIPARHRWRAPENLVCYCLAALYIIALYGVDPTVGYLSRHFMAALALLTIPATAGLHRLAKLSTDRPRPARALILVLAVKTTFAAVLVLSGMRDHLATYAAKYAARAESRQALAQWLNGRLAPGQSYVHGDVGLAGYLTGDLQIIDAYCLNNPEMTAGPMDAASERLVARVIETQPMAVVVASKSPHTMAPRSSKFRDIMRHPTFERRYRHAKTFATRDDDFNYWVYLRRPPRSFEDTAHSP